MVSTIIPSTLSRHEQADRHQELVVINMKADMDLTVVRWAHAETARDPNAMTTNSHNHVPANVCPDIVSRHAVAI